MQTFADAAKLFLKETIVPSSANKGVFLIAPMITFVLALIVWAVVPFDAGVVLANLNVGILYIFAVSSMWVYGIIMSGWASNSKYAFLGGLRSAAQMVSYEVSMGFILVTVMLYASSLNLSAIVLSQKGNILGIFNGNVFNPLLFPMFVMFFITALAETNRAPFDLPEAEAELVAGYQVEYSSMAFALFFLGEYANILFMCALIATLFLGGWLPPLDWAPLYIVPGFLWFFAKLFAMFFAFAWVKGDGAALPLRPVDAAGVEGLPPAQPVLGGGGQRLADVHGTFRVMRNRPLPSLTAVLVTLAIIYIFELAFLVVGGELRSPRHRLGQRAGATVAYGGDRLRGSAGAMVF